VRSVRVLDNDAVIRREPDGVTYVTSPFPLGPYPVRLTDKLDEWAEKAPDRIFLADRIGPPGPLRRPATDGPAAAGWRTVTFRQAREYVRAIAQALLDRGLSADRPIVILSGNSVDHGLLALGAIGA